MGGGPTTSRAFRSSKRFGVPARDEGEPRSVVFVLQIGGMSASDPVDPRIRLAISQWPEDAPRGSVVAFCAEQGISRNTFYKILKRAREESPAVALEPRSRRPRSSPSRIYEEVRREAVDVRAALERSGLDHGPISVHEKMRSLGLDAPSVASLVRIFRQAGVARLEPRKKPRASFRRFVYPAPNCCWQLDATEYVLTGGRKCVIFQLIDDHSRYAVASLVARGETSEAAIEVVRRGIEQHGVPQRLLTDNGLALNPSRRGVVGQLRKYVTALGVEAITGKPYKPTTQGKNERFHQTLMRWLDKQPIVATIAELQIQVDEFDVVYNTERPHQGLPGRVTPQTAWESTPKAGPPKPRPEVTGPTPPSKTATPPATRAVEGIRQTKIRSNGTVKVRSALYQVGGERAGDMVYVIYEEDAILFFDGQGDLIIEHAWAKPGVKYVGNGKP